VSYQFTPQGRVPKFHPGQFLHLALDAYSPDRPWPESRVFSIASATSERTRELAVTISVKGAYTQRIFSTLQEGSECWLKLPYGEFLFPDDRPLALIAGGVGITPYLSLLKHRLEMRSEQQIHLFYGVRSAEYYLFGDLLKHCGRNCRTSTRPFTAKTARCRKKGHSGHQRGSRRCIGRFSLLSVGPAGHDHHLRNRLSGLDVEQDHIRVDDWE
jgi:ferredoxin-NADP reductase